MKKIVLIIAIAFGTFAATSVSAQTTTKTSDKTSKTVFSQKSCCQNGINANCIKMSKSPINCDKSNCKKSSCTSANKANCCANNEDCKKTTSCCAKTNSTNTKNKEK